VEGACSTQRRNEKYKILVGKPEGKRPLGRTRRRLENNITVDLREKGWEVVEWIHLAQGREQWWDLMYTITKRAG
jgi:hypothetical protein